MKVVPETPVLDDHLFSSLTKPHNCRLVIAKARSAPLMMVASIEHGDKHC